VVEDTVVMEAVEDVVVMVEDVDVVVAVVVSKKRS